MRTGGGGGAPPHVWYRRADIGVCDPREAPHGGTSVGFVNQ